MNRNNNFIERLTELMGEEETRPFARRCGMTDTSIRNYLKGTDPTLKSLIKIAAACGVTVGWLIGEENEKNNILATITPGDETKRQRLKENSSRPTVAKPALRWVVEWLDKEYDNDLGQEYFFVEDLKKNYQSLKNLIEKKQGDKDHQNGSMEVKSSNGS